MSLSASGGRWAGLSAKSFRVEAPFVSKLPAGRQAPCSLAKFTCHVIKCPHFLSLRNLLFYRITLFVKIKDLSSCGGCDPIDYYLAVQHGYEILTHIAEALDVKIIGGSRIKQHLAVSAKLIIRLP